MWENERSLLQMCYATLYAFSGALRLVPPGRDFTLSWWLDGAVMGVWLPFLDGWVPGKVVGVVGVNGREMATATNVFDNFFVSCFSVYSYFH